MLRACSRAGKGHRSHACDRAVPLQQWKPRCHALNHILSAFLSQLLAVARSRPTAVQLQFVATFRGGVHRDSHSQETHWFSGSQERGGGGELVAKEDRVDRPSVDDDQLEIVLARHGQRGQRDAEDSGVARALGVNIAPAASLVARDLRRKRT